MIRMVLQAVSDQNQKLYLLVTCFEIVIVAASETPACRYNSAVVNKLSKRFLIVFNLRQQSKPLKMRQSLFNWTQ